MSELMKQRRLDSIDVARGAAVVLLFVDHALVLLDRNTPAWILATLQRMMDVCIPMFMGISGLTLAYLLRSRPATVNVTCTRYARRAALLLLCHPVITLGIWPLYWDKRSFTEILLLRWHITDVIAVCLILAPPLIITLGRRTLVVVAIVLPVLSRAITAFWHPSALAADVFKEFLFGIDDYDSVPALLNVYPVGPYFAMFLVGALLAGPLSRSIADGRVRRFAVMLLAGCAGLFVIGVVAAGGYVFAHEFLARGGHARWLAFLYPSKISWLLPVYLAMAGVVLAAAVWRTEHRRRYGPGDYALTVFGRTALFCYIVQYFVVQAAPACLGWLGAVPPLLFVPLAGALTLVMWLAAWLYAIVKGRTPAREYARLRARVMGYAVGLPGRRDGERLPVRAGPA